MPVMWPRVLPEWVIQDPRRAAEREVFRSLERVLPDEWSVYYSRPWWGISPKGAELDGEADFIVAHPTEGVLFLEVKGGRVEYDPTFSRWTSVDREGVGHKIKDPIHQASSAKHQMLRKFQKSRSWPTYRVRLRHGAIFSDCEASRPGNIGSYERELFCCSREFRDAFFEWILSRLKSHVRGGNDIERGPGTGGIAVINSTIAAPAKLSVPLHRQIGSDIARQDELLTGAQLLAVSSIDASSRTVVEGGAGTGKTVIACELAVRYARMGRVTLLCCLSEPLATSLKRRIGVINYLEIKTMAEIAAEEFAGEGRKVRDAVIVDEGQDIAWEQWDLIESLVAPERGLLRVMFDSNQAIYRARDDLETRLRAVCFPLRLNIRNTKQVAAVTEGLYRGPLIDSGGPDGNPPVSIEASPASVIDQAGEVVIDLVDAKHVLPADIAILLPNEKATDLMKAKLLTARKKVTDATVCTPGCVVVDTIARFKGLEAAAVVLVVDRPTAYNSELSYVGVSRARALLIVIGPLSDTPLGNVLRELRTHDVKPSR